MKKTFIIALCCLSVLFAACNKEKPYEKFVGDYEGSGIVNGTLSVTLMGQTNTQEIKDMAMAMNINLAAGQADNEVILTYINEDAGETYTAKGVITDDTVDFEPIKVNINVGEATVEVTLDLAGTLIETILSLNGTITGNGTFQYEDENLPAAIPVPFTLDGTVAANLNKVTVTPTN